MPIVINNVLDKTLDTSKIKFMDLKTKDYSDIDIAAAFEPEALVPIKFED